MISSSYKYAIYEETWPRSSPSSTRAAETDMSRLGLELRPWTRPLAKNYLNSLLITIRNIYMSSRHGSPPLQGLHEHTWTALGYRRIALSSCLTLNIGILTSGTCKSLRSMSGKTHSVGVTNTEKLDQCHLHPLHVLQRNQDWHVTAGIWQGDGKVYECPCKVCTCSLSIYLISGSAHCCTNIRQTTTRF
jgi:hypothetical protein